MNNTRAALLLAGVAVVILAAAVFLRAEKPAPDSPDLPPIPAETL